MSQRGDSIRKRFDGCLETRLTSSDDDHSKAKYNSIYGLTYADATNKMNGLLSDIERDTENITFKEVSLLWIETKGMALKQSTIEKYSNILSKYLYPFCGNKKILCLDTKEMNNYFFLLKDHLSASMVQSITSVFNSIIYYAKSEGYTTGIPNKVGIRQKKKCTTKTISTKERRQFEEFLIRDVNLYRLGIYLCLYTGIRIGELCALKWCDIDTTNGLIHINKTIQRVNIIPNSSVLKTQLIITEPKTYSSNRVIPLPIQLTEMIAPFKNNDTFFFLSSSDKPIEPRRLQYWFKKYLKEAGLPDINFHALRHSFATECVSAGFDIKSLSEILGHSSVKTTLDRYVHSSDEQKRKQMNMLYLNMEKSIMRESK